MNLLLNINYLPAALGAKNDLLSSHINRFGIGRNGFN